MTKTSLPFALCLLLTGCMTYATAVPAGGYKVGNSYRIELDHSWAKLDAGAPKGLAATVFTMDGLLLDRVYLVDSLDSGKPLVATSDPKKPTPTFRTDMSPTELAEFITDSLSAQDYKNVESRALRSQPFGRVDGIRFEISAANASGLIVSGTAQVAVIFLRREINDRVQLAIDDRDLRQGEVDSILRSVTLL
jgi:hypothetical protein